MVLLRILFISSFVLTSTAQAFDFDLDLNEKMTKFDDQYGATPWIILGGSAATAMAYLMRKDRSYRKRQSYEETQPLQGLGFIGDIIGYGFLNGSYTLALGWYGYKYDDVEAKRSAELMARASAYTLATTMLLKNIIHEKRPGYPDDDQSFPSGHSAASFAFASVVTLRHGWGWGSLAYTMAGFIAVSRVNDDYHYLHDLLAGATIGAAYAYGVHQNFKNGQSYWFSLAPLPQGLGAVASLEF